MELKLTKTARMAFSRLESHQELALLAAQSGGFVYKISDLDTFSQKPCDMIIMRHVPAYVAVMFYRRGQNDFWLIPIQEWVKLRETKSLEGKASFLEADCRGEWLRILKS